MSASVICPTFVSESGMWADTGLKAPAAAGEVPPAQVAEAVVKAIKDDRAEIVVAPLVARFGGVLGGAVPELTLRLARASGATSASSRAAEQQRRKR